ncbi:aldose epimerase family protein [Gayadomonas joobiniege]|uniref:aldose epimerase family protein n=1 Tax=Gayadomonas joobiniege TaxID=1234606 RepID=UPI0003810338|nr:aldose epimerase family protein [Gayadomonas joobiniege]
MTVQQPTIERSLFGTLPDGQKIHQFVLKNAQGTEATIIEFGAILQDLKTADKNGQFGSIVLGYKTLEEYQTNPFYLGATIGRYGNRIANGQCYIDGVKYTFDVNNGENHLHGGVSGFDKKVWTGETFNNENCAGVILKTISPDGDQGYPGRLELTCEYHLTNDNQLIIKYSATTDKTTIINLTNHSYFNLAGRGDVLNHTLNIPTYKITPLNTQQIPTGEVKNIKNTPFDFTQSKKIGQDIDADDEQIKIGSGYDHNYVLEGPVGELKLAAHASEPSSGREIKIYTTEPGFQFYTANWINNINSHNGEVFNERGAFCIEPQHVPDAPNQPQFDSTELKPGERYVSEMRYQF